MIHQRIDASLEALTREAGRDPTKTRHITVGPDALDSMARWLAAERPTASSDVVICDPNTASAAGLALQDKLRGAGRAPVLCVLEPQAGHEELVCDDGLIERLTAELATDARSNPIAVGAGTVNDTVKMACTKLDRPYQSVPTAASMNGYTSAIAAVLSKGVKRTLPTRQAEAVFADVDVIRSAPARLNLAGFGDLLSKPYSNADWRLSHVVRGVPYDERSARLLDEAFEALLVQAREIGAREPDGIGTLTRTILLSGFAMAIAGTSAPASGGEHLISHYWDMVCHARHEPILGLHGTQVGIATLLSAMLFERLVALDAAAFDASRAALRRPDDGWLAQLVDIHHELPGEIVGEIRAQLAAKQRHGTALADEIATIGARWSELSTELGAMLVPASRIEAALESAGAPRRPSDIGVDRARAVHTLRVCRHIRNRYVALDLMDDLGMLDGWAEQAVTAVEERPA